MADRPRRERPAREPGIRQQQSDGQQSDGQQGSFIFEPPFKIRIDGSRYVDRHIDGRQYVLMKLIQTIDAECCPQVLAEPMGEEAAEKLAAALRVLADPARLRLLSLIGAHPDGEACVCNLTGPLGLSQPTVSHHLKVLADAGLLEREQRGRWAYFTVHPEPLELLRAALAAPVGGALEVAASPQ
jgi:ArsR family transcriptional regulator